LTNTPYICNSYHRNWLDNVHSETAPKKKHDRDSIVAWAVLEEMLDGDRDVTVFIRKVKVEKVEHVFVVSDLLHTLGG
jgi:hypothetical protein